MQARTENLRDNTDIRDLAAIRFCSVTNVPLLVSLYRNTFKRIFVAIISPTGVG